MAIPSNQYTTVVQQAATKYGVPVELLAGTLQQESGFNPYAVNSNANGTTDYGIAQLNTKYYPDAYTMSPEQQIDKAASILSTNYRSAGNWYDAVRAYNAGETGAKNSDTLGKAHADNVFKYAGQYGYGGATSVTVPVSSGNPIDNAIATGNPIEATNIFEWFLEGFKNIPMLFDPETYSGPNSVPAALEKDSVQGLDNWFKNRVASFQAWTEANALSGAIILAGGVIITFALISTISNQAPSIMKAVKT